MQRFELNISREPKTNNGGIIVHNYGQLLELYVEDDEQFYVIINSNDIIHSSNNKIIFNNIDNINMTNNIIVYNVNINNQLIAVFNIKKEHAIFNNLIVYN